MSNSFSFLLQKFLTDYIIDECNYSIHTRSSYSTTFYLLLIFLREVYNLTPKAITFDNIDVDHIISFLDWIENKKGNSIATRNQRLAAIKSFFQYVQYRKPELMNTCTLILDIKTKKTPNRIISYFTEEEMKIIFQYLNNQSNLKYLTLISVLYETGARVQELINIKISDISLTNRATIILHGKGNKTRIVPLSENIVKLTNKYLREFYTDYGEGLLFYSKNRRIYSRNGINYIVKTLVEKLHKLYPGEFKGQYHPHSFRHAKATHLYNNGIPLLTIKEFLGHSSIITTEIYATPDTQIMRTQLLTNSNKIDIMDKYNKDDLDDLEVWLKVNMK